MGGSAGFGPPPATDPEPAPSAGSPETGSQLRTVETDDVVRGAVDDFPKVRADVPSGPSSSLRSLQRWAFSPVEVLKTVKAWVPCAWPSLG